MKLSRLNSLIIAGLLGWVFLFYPVSSQAITINKTNLTTVTKNQVAYYTFDGTDVDATHVYDKSGNNHTGAPTSVSYSMGAIGQAGSFAGSGYVTSTASQIMTSAGGYNTVSFWMRWNGTADVMPFDFYNGTHYDLWFQNSTCFGFNTWNIDTYGIDPTGLANKWVHVTAVFYNGAYTGKNKIYINGVQQAMTQCYGSANSGTAVSDFTVGSAGLGSGFFFGGKLDDVRIYNRELSSSEIMILAKMAKSPVNKTNFSANSDGLTGYWTMDGPDYNSTTIFDRSGFSRNGTRNGTTTPQKGRLGQALYFSEPSSAYVSSSAQTFSNGFSASFWVKPNSYDSGLWNTYIAQDNWNAGTGWLVYSDDAGCGTIVYSVGGGASQISSAACAAPLSKWTHIVITNNNGSAKIYVNGAVSGSGSVSISNAAVNLYLAARHTNPGTGSTDFFDGAMDDVRTYNRALTQGEVTQLYKLGGGNAVNQGNNPTLTKDLMLYWTFDGSKVDSSNAFDSSGYTRTGTRTSVTPMAGRLGQGFSFNGSSSDVSGSNFDWTTNDGRFTFSAWVKPQVVAGGHMVWIHGTGFSGNGCYINSFSNMYVTCGTTQAMDPDTLPLNKWSLVTAVRDGTKLRLYVNGVEKANVARGSLTAPTGSFIVGRYSGGQFWQGGIDEVRMYNRALSPQEVYGLYKQGR